MQENRNYDHKTGIKMMGANKTKKAVERLTKALGGKRKIVENFDEISKVASQSMIHTHRSSDRDETLVREDLRRLGLLEKRLADPIHLFLNDLIIHLRGWTSLSCIPG